MIIAEIGINHLGSEEYLRKYLDVLLSSSVDAVTLQIREDEFYTNEKYSDMQLSLDVYDRAISLVKSSGKKFGIALSNLSFVHYFEQRVDFYKILSKDLGNADFVNSFINVVDKPIYISTGMSSYEDIASFIGTIKTNKRNNINLIHTRLSNQTADTNLKAISKMKEVFDRPIAFGNHCRNLNVVFASLAYDPAALFLYIKGDAAKQHPDEEHAISLSHVVNFVDNIRDVVKSFGTSLKETTKNTIKGQK